MSRSASASASLAHSPAVRVLAFTQVRCAMLRNTLGNGCKHSERESAEASWARARSTKLQNGSSLRTALL